MTLNRDQTLRMIEGEREATRKLLSERSDPDRTATRVALRVYHHFDRVTAPAAGEVACHEGCAWCCRGVKVDVTAPEALAIADYLRTTSHSEDDFAEVRDALSEAAEHARGLSIDGRARDQTPCFFLDEETSSCLIYELRPLRCRGHASFDASACEDAARHPDEDRTVPVQFIVQQAAGLFTLGQIAGIGDAGCDSDSYELTNAVHVALSAPNASRRWVAGEDVMRAARTPHDDDDTRSSARATARLIAEGTTEWSPTVPTRRRSSAVEAKDRRRQEKKRRYEERRRPKK